MIKLSGIPGIKANLFGGANFQEIVVNFDGCGKTVDEIHCHAKGARFMYGPSVRTGGDLGGQPC